MQEDDPYDLDPGLISVDRFRISCERIGAELEHRLAAAKKKAMGKLGNEKMAQRYVEAVDDVFSFSYLLRLTAAMGSELRQLRAAVSLHEQLAVGQQEIDVMDLSDDVLIVDDDGKGEKPN